MNRFIIFFVIAVLVVGGAWWYVKRGEDSARQEELAAAQRSVQAENELKNKMNIEDVVVGTGAEAKSGNTVTVNYTGTLTDGTKFDSSYDHGQPFSFLLGAGQVIKGWDLGVAGMKVGGKRKLTIPAELAYGAAGVPGRIAPNSTLLFTVELLKVE